MSPQTLLTPTLCSPPPCVQSHGSPSGPLQTEPCPPNTRSLCPCSPHSWKSCHIHPPVPCSWTSPLGCCLPRAPPHPPQSFQCHSLLGPPAGMHLHAPCYRRLKPGHVGPREDLSNERGASLTGAGDSGCLAWVSGESTDPGTTSRLCVNRLTHSAGSALANRDMRVCSHHSDCGGQVHVQQ